MPLSSRHPLRKLLTSLDGLRIPPKFWRLLFRRYLWIALAILLPLLALRSCGAWFHDKWTARQSRQLATQAETHLRQGRATEARMALDTALRLNPSNTSALRSLAALQTAQGQPADAMKTWQQLVDAGGLVFSDIPPYARLAAETQDWEIARRLLDATKAGAPPSLPHLLQAELSTIRGDHDSAENSLRTALSLDPSRESRAALARFLLIHKNTPENSPEILTHLRDLSREKNELGALALASALENNLVPPDELDRWITTLNRHPKATPAMLLVADTARIRRDPATRPLVAATVFARLGNESLDARTAGLHWLLAAKEPDLAARLVTPDEALARPDLLVKWLDALSASGRRQQLLEILDHPANPLPSVQTRLYRANTLKLLGRPDEARDIHRALLEENSTNPEATLKILTYLYLAGENTVFENELRTLLSKSATARPALQALLPVVQSLRDIHQLRRLHELAHDSGGLTNTLQLRNEIDYCDLLLGRPVEPRSLEILARRNPENLPFRLTWTLHLLATGQAPRALVELDSLARIHTTDPHLFARRELLRATAHAATGDRAQALKIQARLPRKNLTLQETALLSRTLLFQTPDSLP